MLKVRTCMYKFVFSLSSTTDYKYSSWQAGKLSRWLSLDIKAELPELGECSPERF